MPDSYGNFSSWTTTNPIFYATTTSASATFDFNPDYPAKRQPKPKVEPSAVDWLRGQVAEVCEIGRAA